MSRGTRVFFRLSLMIRRSPGKAPCATGCCRVDAGCASLEAHGRGARKRPGSPRGRPLRGESMTAKSLLAAVALMGSAAHAQEPAPAKATQAPATTEAPSASAPQSEDEKTLYSMGFQLGQAVEAF